MSLFDSASLVVTPSGYKEDKLYSIKPTDGSGDLNVVRSTTATRVNSAGLVELVPYNLLTYSQDFDNAAWTKTNVTITANSTESPDGNLTADTLTKSSTGVDGSVVRTVSATATGYVGSIFVKKDTNTSRFPELFLRSSDAAGENEIYVQLNTSTGATAIRLQFGTVSVSTPVLINGYWRLSFYVLANSNTCRFGIRPAAGTTLGVYNANATGSIIAWGAQLEDGTSAKEYFPTSDRLNVPRLDYTNSTCPSILVEPQRTNTILQSENLATSWTSFRSVVTTDVTTSPSGLSNADKVAQQSGNVDAGGVYQTISISNGTTYTYSFYAKAAGYNWTFARVIDGGTNYYVWFNLATGVVGTITGSATAKIQNSGNGWYRCSVTFTSTGTGNQVVNYVANADNSDQIPSPDSVKGIYLWGAQLEAGSYATSYVPTVASSVTRNADVISKTGISSLIGQTEGTIFVDFNFKQGIESFILGAGNGSYYNNLAIECYSNKAYLTIFNNSSSLQGTIETSTLTTGKHKLAVAYNSTQVTMYLDGVLVNSLGAITFPSFNNFYLGNLGSDTNPKNININSSSIWKSKLSNTELATLTTI